MNNNLTCGSNNNLSCANIDQFNYLVDKNISSHIWFLLLFFLGMVIFGILFFYNYNDICNYLNKVFTKPLIF